MTAFYIIHISICIFMVIVILLQPGKSDAGIGFGSSSQSIFGSKGAGNFLTKTTGICAMLYLVMSFYLTWDRVKDVAGMKIKEEATKTEVPVTPESKAPAAPVPGAKEPGGVAAPAPAPAKAEPNKK